MAMRTLEVSYDTLKNGSWGVVYEISEKMVVAEPMIFAKPHKKIYQIKKATKDEIIHYEKIFVQ